MNTPDEVFRSAGQYLCISAAGMVFVFGYHLIGAVLRGTGDAKRPLAFAAASAALNIALDLLFVWGMGMGPLGAAAATVIAQGIGFLLGVFSAKRPKFLIFASPHSTLTALPWAGSCGWECPRASSFR